MILRWKFRRLNISFFDALTYLTFRPDKNNFWRKISIFIDNQSKSKIDKTFSVQNSQFDSSFQSLPPSRYLMVSQIWGKYKWGFLYKNPQKSPREYSANRKPYNVSNAIKRDNSTRSSNVVLKLNFVYRTSVAKGNWHNPFILVDCQHFQRSYADASFWLAGYLVFELRAFLFRAEGILFAGCISRFAFDNLYNAIVRKFW